MKVEMTINVDDYLTEEDKKELAIDVFKGQLVKYLFNGASGEVQNDAEVQRVVGNISHKIVMNELSKFIPNCEDMIVSKVKDTLNKANYNFEVFKQASAWGDKESLAVTYITQTVNDSKDLIQSKVKESISNYNPTEIISIAISDEFANMGETIYKLSELFQVDK